MVLATMAARPAGPPAQLRCRLLFICVLCWMCFAAYGYEFDLIFQTKCVMEEVSTGTEVTGDYRIYRKTDVNTPVALDVRIEDPAGVVRYENRAETSGSFNFVSPSDGDYKLCFTARDFATAQDVRIQLNWRTGAAAHDWELVARKDNLNFIQTELLKLEQSVHDIQLELQNIRRREERMRDVNEATNSRVAWFGVGALIVCTSLAGWQLYYLQRFFIRKKIL